MKKLNILLKTSVGSRLVSFSYRSRIDSVLIPYQSRIVLLSFSYRSPIFLLSFSYWETENNTETIRKQYGMERRMNEG